MSHRPFAVAAAVFLALGGALAALGPAAGADAPEVTQLTILGHLDVEIRATLFRPADASATNRVPLVLHSHGWAGSRADSLGDSGTVDALVEAGFGVLSVDARGHGQSGGAANVHHKDVEVRDFVRVLDAVAALDWVAVDADDCAGDGKDRVLGATGGSYGGGYQLMTASYDCRLDALVPEITWTDLTYSLAPEGVVKSAWVHALYGGAKATGTRIDPKIDRWYGEVMLRNEIPADAYLHFKGASPVPSAITADVLLVQGIPDALFNLNEAVANYRALEGGVAGDVRLSTHLTGHILNARMANGNMPNVGLQPFGVGVERLATPCGTQTSLVLAWMDAKLRGNAAAAADIPEVCLAFDDGTAEALDAFPTTLASNAVEGAVALQGAGSVLVPLANPGADLAGIGHLRATATAPQGAKFAAAFVVVSPDGSASVVDDQAAAVSVPIGCVACAVDVDLVGVAGRLGPDDRLFLQLDAAAPWFFSNSGRVPGAVVLRDVVVDVPVLG